MARAGKNKPHPTTKSKRMKIFLKILQEKGWDRDAERVEEDAVWEDRIVPGAEINGLKKRMI